MAVDMNAFKAGVVSSKFKKRSANITNAIMSKKDSKNEAAESSTQEFKDAIARRMKGK